MGAALSALTLMRERFGLPGLLSVLSRTFLVWSLAERGDVSEGIARGEEAVRVAEGLPLLEQGMKQAASARVMFDHSLWVAWLSEAYLLAGRMDAAMRLAARALDLSRERKERGHEAWSLGRGWVSLPFDGSSEGCRRSCPQVLSRSCCAPLSCL